MQSIIVALRTSAFTQPKGAMTQTNDFSIYCSNPPPPPVRWGWGGCSGVGVRSVWRGMVWYRSGRHPGYMIHWPHRHPQTDKWSTQSPRHVVNRSARNRWLDEGGGGALYGRESHRHEASTTRLIHSSMSGGVV